MIYYDISDNKEKNYSIETITILFSVYKNSINIYISDITFDDNFNSKYEYSYNSNEEMLINGGVVELKKYKNYFINELKNYYKNNFFLKEHDDLKHVIKYQFNNDRDKFSSIAFDCIYLKFSDDELDKIVKKYPMIITKLSLTPEQKEKYHSILKSDEYGLFERKIKSFKQFLK